MIKLYICIPFKKLTWRVAGCYPLGEAEGHLSEPEKNPCHFSKLMPPWHLLTYFRDLESLALEKEIRIW